MTNEKLENKIDELEKKIEFLYGALNNQLAINQKLIDNIGELGKLRNSDHQYSKLFAGAFLDHLEKSEEEP